MRNVIWIIFFMLISTGELLAQTVVETGSAAIIIKRREDIIVAADSRVLTEHVGERQTTCKIKQVGEVVFVNTGFLGSPINNFDLPTLATTACKKEGSIYEKVKYFEELVQTSLLTTILDVKRRLPSFYKTHYEGKALLIITFIGRDSGRVVYLSRTIELKNDGEGTPFLHIIREDCPGICRETGDNFIFGDVAEMLQYLNSHAGMLNSNQPTKLLLRAINKVMAIGIKARPDSIGSPIDILQITNDQFTWLQKKESCK